VTVNDAGADRTFALRSVWHIVGAGPITGPMVGPFYLFKCFRWARVDKVRAIHHVRLLADMELCDRCAHIDRRASGDSSTTLPVPDDLAE
jgi:hypothetical protein